MNTRSELELIPIAARVLAGCAFAAVVAIPAVFFRRLGSGFPEIGFMEAAAAICAVFLAAWVLLAGYVYSDASRRGMPPVVWTALAVLVPNCIGFVLYFLMRKPIVHPCPACGNGVTPESAYCPKCGAAQVC